MSQLAKRHSLSNVGGVSASQELEHVFPGVAFPRVLRIRRREIVRCSIINGTFSERASTVCSHLGIPDVCVAK